MFNQEFNYAMVPGDTSVKQNEFYSDHVTLRMKHFTAVIMRVICFERWSSTERNGRLNLSQMLSQNAEAQVSIGMYNDLYKLDAAHLMNTTVKPDVMKQGITLTLAQAAAVDELEVLSAATTMQYKANNVGPDKVIDRCMSDFVAGYGYSLFMPRADGVLNEIANSCIARLTGSKKSSKDNYAAAIEGAAAAKLMNTSDIDADVEQWAESLGFV